MAEFVEEVFAAAATEHQGNNMVTPKNHKHAVSLPNPEECQEWRFSEIDEFNSHRKNKTFGPETELPPGFTAIPTAWVHANKRSGIKKSRVVVRGYHMVAGIDFNETFAPVARIKSIRILLALCAKYDMELLPFDVKTAFLSAEMDTEVYVTLPPAFNDDPALQPDAKNSKTVHRLLKGVPGIPQGSHLFNNKVHSVLSELDYGRAPDDYCLYVHKTQSIFIALWTDDGYIVHKNQPEVKLLTEALTKNFEVKFLNGEQLDLLGVSVTRDRPNKTITLCQEKTVESLLNKAGMKDCNPAATPVATNFVFTKKDCPQSAMEIADLAADATWYRSILATIIYIVMWTRPDAAFAMSKLSKFMHNPGTNHIKALKRLVRYLQGTKDYKLIYDFSSPAPHKGVYGYFDSAHNDDVDTCRSTMAYLFFFEGCLISWFSKLHSYVTTSTNHSEYVASAKAAREANWLHKIFKTLKLEDAVSPINLFNDNKGAIAMNYNPVQHEASKHVALADHYAREQVERGIITVTHVKTEECIADVLTKALGTTKFNRLISQFMN